MMAIFNTTLVISTAIYCITLLWLLAGLFRLKPGQSEEQPRVSVIVPARNEAATIQTCLEALLRQTYPVDKLELIFVDDRSTDETAAIIRAYANRYHQIRLVSVTAEQPQLVGKKNAITQGIAQSNGTLILALDADCQPGAEWVRQMVRYFEPDVGVVAGYVYTETPAEHVPHWQRMRGLERLGVVAVAAGSMGWNVGITCTANNFAYRRQVFEEVNGFAGIGHIRSGDDDLFVQKIFRETSWQFRYATHPGTFVRTQVPTSLQQAWQQEKRRSSKAKYYPLWLVLALIPPFVMNLQFGVALLTGFWWQGIIPVAGGCFGAKTLIEGLVMVRTSALFKRWDLWRYFPLVEILYIPYFVVLAVVGTFGKYRWKD
ncbi:MAG: glycosyltransferase [Gemmatimonadetes bacterium]|nr:MAG: glycosyltransferase [Gemmatimonadota bacterium]